MGGKTLANSGKLTTESCELVDPIARRVRDFSLSPASAGRVKAATFCLSVEGKSQTSLGGRPTPQIGMGGPAKRTW